MKQPDGQLLEQKQLLPDSLGGAHYGLRLQDDAPLGRWTINLKTAAGRAGQGSRAPQYHPQ